MCTDDSSRFAAVRCQPVLEPGKLFGRHRPVSALPFPLGRADALLTYSGTAAVYQAFRSLGLQTGSTVLCPSYNCGHEIEALIRLGLRIECYRVTWTLDADLEDIERRLSTAGACAVLVTHYFGFGQTLGALREICDRRGVYLVEDCAHALFSDNAEGTLGRTGDAAAYSMRKTLPIPNGGAVVFNNPTLRSSRVPGRPPRTTTALKALELAAKGAWDRYGDERGLRDVLWLAALLPPLLGARALRAVSRRRPAFYDPDDEDLAFSIDIMSWGISRLSMRIMDSVEPARIVERRRTNYLHLARALSESEDYRPLRPNLEEGVCPLYLPVWTEHPAAAYRRLAAERIYSAVLWQEEHPAIDWVRYPEARELKKHVLALPVHQDVDARDVERVSAVLRGL